MSLISTKTPIFDDIPSIHFFNGRLLSGEDLTTEQAWNAARRKLLGQAVGSGVAFGLEVRISENPDHVGRPIVSVEPGLAINSEGELLHLAEPTDVSLVQLTEPEAVTAEFSACQPLQYSAYVKSDGVYLLSLCSATGTQGRAPVMGLANQEARCNRKYRREGVQFRLHQLKLTNTELADRNKLRNLVAYKCFNPDAWQTFLADPFGADKAKPKLLDGLLVPKLEDCEVPLATIFWTTDGGIEYVDLWSVRRRPAISLENAASWTHLNGWGAAESEARVQQLYWHMLEVGRRIETPETAIAATYFRRLPAVGIVPVTGSNSEHGFRPGVLFGALVRESPRTIDRVEAVSLLAKVGAAMPIDLDTVKRLYLYWVQDNFDAVDRGDASQRYVLYSIEPLYPIEESVRRCLLEASSAYSSLLAQGKFVPPDARATARAIVQLIGFVERIIQTAIGGTSMLYRATDNQVIVVFQGLYRAQSDLITFLRTPALGSGNVDRRQEFVDLMVVPLDRSQGATGMSLSGAIQRSDVTAAVAAQNRITALVLGHSGVVTTGNLDVVYRGEVTGRGETLVRGGGETYRYRFEVSNRTNRTTDIDLEIAFRHDTESWDDSASLVGATQIFALAPNEVRDVRVAVTTPDGEVGESGVLTLTARVAGEPTIFDSDFATLSIGLAETPGDTIRFDGAPVLERGDPSAAPIGQRTSFSFAYRYHSDAGQSRSFKAVVVSTTDAAIARLFGVSFSADDPPIPVVDPDESTPQMTMSESFSVASDRPGQFRVDIIPGAGSSRNSFTYRVRLISDDGRIDATADEVIIMAA